MEKEQLIGVMLYESKRFNKTGTEATEDTVIGDVLKEVDGLPGSNPPQIFEEVTKWAIHNNKDEVKSWPEGWLSLTFKELAGSLIALLMLLFVNIRSQAQLTVNLSAVKTELKQGAIQFGIYYLKNLDSLFGGKQQIRYGSHSVFAFTPTFNIQSGTNDAMSSIDVKLTGLGVIFKTTTVNGITVADLQRTFTTIPLSAGVETNDQFNFINGLVEAGFVPWWGGEAGKHIQTGLYLQAGYKFRIDSTHGMGGNADQSEEALNDGLFRLKGIFSVDTKKLFSIGLVNVGLIGTATGWYDLVNKVPYHRIDGILRLYLNNNSSLDIKIQHGSGAPNFNSGTQYSGGLTINF